MKLVKVKTLLAVLMIAFMTGLVGCGSDSEDTQAVSNNPGGNPGFVGGTLTALPGGGAAISFSATNVQVTTSYVSAGTQQFAQYVYGLAPLTLGGSQFGGSVSTKQSQIVFGYPDAGSRLDMTSAPSGQNTINLSGQLTLSAQAVQSLCGGYGGGYYGQQQTTSCNPQVNGLYISAYMPAGIMQNAQVYICSGQWGCGLELLF